MTVRKWLSRARRLIRWNPVGDLPAFAQLSWAQEAEDLLLVSLHEQMPPRSRFYVDVGAHHPQRFSNTWLFYQQGWRGINIDPVPGVMDEFKRVRPRDINLEVAISDRVGTARFFIFDETAVSTMSESLAKEREEETPYRITTELDVPTRTLTSVLEEHQPPGDLIDFMTVDVEGHELKVVRSLDWTRWRPTFLLIEALDAEDAHADLVAETIAEIGYRRVVQTPRTVFYRDRFAKR